MILSIRPATLRTIATVTSFVVSVGVFALKYWAYVLTNSAAIRSDALENVVNCVTSLFALGAVAWANRPADDNHPYGHGKIEFFSAALEGGLISLAALLILFDATRTLLAGVEVHRLDLGLALSSIAGGINGILGWGLIRVGRQTRSAAIEADGHHILSDFLTTLGVIAGLVATYLTGLAWLDPVIAIAVAFWLAYNGVQLVRKAAQGLLDTEDPNLIESLVAQINASRPPDIISVHGLRAIRSGAYLHVDVHLVVPEFYEVSRGHELVESYSHSLFGNLSADGELHTHIDPCERRYCESCPVSPCPIRRTEFKALQPISVSEAKSKKP